MKKINELKTLEELASYLNIRKQLLTYVLYGKKESELYTRFTIPKKDGGEREIHAPIKPLKSIQKTLAYKLDEHISCIVDNYQIINRISHGFIKDKSIITNAKVHRNKRYVLNIDLEDFFPSLHFGRVRGFLIHNKYFKVNPYIATLIAQLSCFNNFLPQGSPTSPIISNLIANNLDMNILKITQKYNLTYTRYVDDLTFSTNEKNFIRQKNDVLKELEILIHRSGFKINTNKTRLQSYQSRQTVTGLTVNEKVNVKKEFHKNTRAMAHHLYSKGFFNINGKEGTINELEGRFTHVNQLDWLNNKTKENKYNEEIPYNNLNSREKEYQKFIFYRNFISNQPLLITEGKTDITYLKAALRKKHLQYPSLIDKNESKFSYKISFLNRFNQLNKNSEKQNKWLYFFNLAPDGAAPLDKIIESYIGVKKNNINFPGYWNFFEHKKISPSNPVIILLDNDQELTNFIKRNQWKIASFLIKSGKLKKESKSNFKDKIHKELKINYYTYLFGNIYLLTLPKPDSKDMEMESLFNKKDIEQFNILNKRPNINKEQINTSDKDVFSKYVLKNYQSINFEKFNPILERIYKIINLYE